MSGSSTLQDNSGSKFVHAIEPHLDLQHHTLSTLGVMPLLWLATIGHLEEREFTTRNLGRQKKQEGRGGERRKRARFRLPETDFLAERLADSGVDVQYEGDSIAIEMQRRTDVEKANVSIFALMDIRQGTEYEGRETLWNDEAQTLRSYYKNACDIYTVEVKDIFELQHPRTCIGEVNARGEFKPTHGYGSMLFRPWAFGAREMREVEAGLMDKIQGWGYTSSDLDSAVCFRCVEPIARMVCQGRWNTLAWRAAWKLPWGQPIFPNYPRAEWVENVCQSKHAETMEEVTHNKVTGLMDDLRRWLPKMLDAVDGEDAEAKAAERSKVLLHLGWLDSLRCHLSNEKMERAEDAEDDDGDTWSTRMVAAHLMADLLCNTEHMAAASAQGAQLLFPGCFTDAVQRKAGKSVR